MTPEDDLRDELNRLNDDAAGQLGWRAVRDIATRRRIDATVRRQLGRTGVGRKLLTHLACALTRDQERRAAVFLAHGFHARDEKLVDALRKELTAAELRVITGLKPAAKSVSQKVLDRIDSTHTFVALFTTAPGTTRQPSAWIISELGYAARKPRVVLLETGLERQQIGGVQGDVEYLRFRRAAPTTAFRLAARAAAEA